MESIFVEKTRVLHQKDPDAYTALTEHLLPISFSRQESILELGDICKNIYLVQSGIVRHFRINDAGEEYNIWFSFEGDICMAMESFVKQIPSVEGIQTIEACECFYISREAINDLANKYHAIETFYREVIQLYYIDLESRLYRLQSQSAREKYVYLLNNNPHFIQRLPLNQVASFLGISKETLSRIRGDLS